MTAAALPDAAGIAGDYGPAHWHGSEVVGAAQVRVFVGMYCDPEQEMDAYVVVATPTTGRWTPDGPDTGIDPSLTAREATLLADEIDALVALAQSGTPLPAPTQLSSLADRLRTLAAGGGVTVVGDHGEIELTAAQLRHLLDAAALSPVTTRRKVVGVGALAQDVDQGTVWIELDTTGEQPVIAVTSVEGTEQPEDYPEGYGTARLPLAEAAALAAILRRFAAAAPAVAAGDLAEPLA